MLSPQTIQQIETLATEMAAMFLPPEMIVGCEVLSVADKDQYATNNGWIEARVGLHNQQRCRWRGQFPSVQVGDYVDVLFFASYRLFVVFGQGGAAAIPDIVKLDDQPIAGAIITGDATPEWVVLPPRGVGQYVTKNETGILEWRDIPTVGITEFLYDTASDIADYFQLKPDVPTGGAQTITSAAISANDTLIATFATNADEPGVDFYNDGVWHLHLHAQQSGPGAKSSTLKFRLYTRTSGGTETQVGTGYSESTTTLTTDVAEYDLHLALNEFSADITDRIVIKLYADISGAGTNPTVTLTVEGNTDARIEIPAVVASGGTGGGWPDAGKAMINNTEYAGVQAAIDAMSAGDIIKVGQGTDSGGIVPDTSGAIVGLSPIETVITRSDNDTITVSIDTPDNVTLKSLTVSHTGAGTSVACVQTNQDGIVLDNVIIEKISGAPTNATGVSVYGGSGDGTYLRNCKIKITSGTNKYGVYASTAACNIVIEGGEINVATADISLTHASNVVELRGVKLIGGVINATTGTLRGWAVDDKGRDCGKVVKNTSGATVARGAIGYLDSAGEFKTATTANNFTGGECVVTVGGPNNGWIFVRRTGNATVNYTGTAPNAGEYLVTSTTAGLAQAQTTMRPEIFAVCLAAGSGGVVEVQLLCNTIPITISPSEVMCRSVPGDDTDFNGTIATLPGGAVLTYNVTSGDENVLDALNANTLAKLRLYNSTRGTYALISDTVLATNSITLTANVPAGWATTDVITVRSQTNINLSGASYYIEYEFTSAELPTLTRTIDYEMTFLDTGAAGERMIVHPWETFSSAKRRILDTIVANRSVFKYDDVPLIEKRFTVQATASGPGTMLYILALRKAHVAAP